MYHPELYPELARKNAIVSPLTIPNEKRYKKRILGNKDNNSSNVAIGETSQQPDTEGEIKLVETENVNSANKDLAEARKASGVMTMTKAIRIAAKQRAAYKDEVASNYFEINSIRHEINHIGEIYLGVNNYKNRSDVLDSYMAAMEADKNDQKFEFNANTKSIQDEKFDITYRYSPSHYVEKNRLNYMTTDAPSLEDLIEDLKSENRISNVYDLSGIPSTENAYGKAVRNPKENLEKIKAYFQKLEKKNAEKSVKDFKEKNKINSNSSKNHNKAGSKKENSNNANTQRTKKAKN